MARGNIKQCARFLGGYLATYFLNNSCKNCSAPNSGSTEVNDSYYNLPYWDHESALETAFSPITC